MRTCLSAHALPVGSLQIEVTEGLLIRNQPEVRATLSEALKGVVAQNLFKRVDKKGRVAALEILVFTTAIANLVREGKTHQLPGMIQVGKKIGNVPLDDAIMDHLRMKRISPEEAYDKCLDKKKFRPFLSTPPLDDEVAAGA